MRSYLIAIYAAGLLALVLPAVGQIKPRVAGLEDNSEYMDLLLQEDRLQAKEDSLNKVVAEVRRKFRDEPQNREESGQSILKLEGEIFEIRNDIGKVAGRITGIEQAFIISNLDNGGGQDALNADSAAGKTLAKSSTSLAEFFKLKLPAGDYKSLLRAQQSESEVTDYIGAYRKNYGSLADIARVYESIDSAALADSVYAEYVKLERENAGIADAIAEKWGFIFENKQYAYNYLLDRLNMMDLLSGFDKESQSMRNAVAAQREEVMSPAVSAYPFQKGLLLDYETAIAGILGLEKTLDSLTAAKKALESADFTFPKLHVTEKLFLDYAEIEVNSPSKYNSRNPIPVCTVYEKGVIYRILLGSFKQQQAVSVFKGVYPLGYLKDEEGRFNYYAGGFDTREKAVAAFEAMKKLGFRAPRLALWDYGKYSLLPDPDAGNILYRIEISGAGDNLPESVKDIVRQDEVNKEISRNGDMFIIAPFHSREEADDLAEAIEDADGKLTADVAEFEI